MADERVRLVLVAAAGTDGEQPVDVERDGPAAGPAGTGATSTLPCTGVPGCSQTAAKPNQLTIIAISPAAKRSPLLTESTSSSLRRCRRPVVDQPPVEVERGDRGRGTRVGTPSASISSPSRLQSWRQKS